jgi:acyl-CoA thioester hydrolase
MALFDLSKFTHTLDLNVRFMDLDALQHVNNARYLNFLEEARLAYSQEILDLFNRIEELNVVVARIEIDFMQPIYFGDKVQVHTRISKLGNKSFTFESMISAKRKGKTHIASRALQVIVAFDPKQNKSIPIPDSVKEKIQQVEGMDTTAQ